MKHFHKILSAAAICFLTVLFCFGADAASRGETARKAYAVKLSRPTIKEESTSSFWFRRPVDLNFDGVPEMIVSQVTSRPVIYSYYNGASRIVYQGNGDGSIVQYYPDDSIFVEISGRMGEYRVWYTRFDGRKSTVLFSYVYEGEPMGLSSQDYIFDHYKVTWYKGDSWTGETISRRRFENLLHRTLKDSVPVPLPSTSYQNTEENRTEYILNSPADSEIWPASQFTDSADNRTEGILISFTPSKNADGYIIYRRDENGSFTSIGKVEGQENTEFLDTEVQKKDMNGTFFYYTVRGYLKDTEHLSQKYDQEGIGITRLRSPGIVRCEEAPEGMSYVRWAKNGAASGYLVQYGTDPGFTECTTVDLPHRDLHYLTAENLEAGKTYYFRVQSYRIQNGIKSFSDWSPAESITAIW